MVEKVPRNLEVNCLSKQFLDTRKKDILLGFFASETRYVVSL